MEFRDIEKMCTRAAKYTYSKTKLAIASVAIVLCGLFVVFAMGASLAANQWITLSLAFLPIFICGGVLVQLGVILIRAFHDEVKNKVLSYPRIIKESLKQFAFSLSVFLPIVLIYLLLWILLGLFFLVSEIPIFGDFFSVVFAFGPFLLILGSIVLSVVSAFLVFAVSPHWALKPFSTEMLTYSLQDLSKQLFFKIVMFIVGLIPLGFTTLLLYIAAKLTTFLYIVEESHLQQVLQWFVIMVPFAVILSPAMVYFFNLAAETYVYAQRRDQESS